MDPSDQVIPQESKSSALRIDYGVVIYRSVFKVEGKSRGDMVRVSHLDEVAVSHGFTGQCPEHKKTVNQALRMMHRYLPED